jgi:hypothetical protein
VAVIAQPVRQRDAEDERGQMGTRAGLLAAQSYPDGIGPGRDSFRLKHRSPDKFCVAYAFFNLCHWVGQPLIAPT